MEDNASLELLHGLESLTRVGGDLIIRNNDALTTLKGWTHSRRSRARSTSTGMSGWSP